MEGALSKTPKSRHATLAEPGSWLVPWQTSCSASPTIYREKLSWSGWSLPTWLASTARTTTASWAECSEVCCLRRWYYLILVRPRPWERERSMEVCWKVFKEEQRTFPTILQAHYSTIVHPSLGPWEREQSMEVCWKVFKEEQIHVLQRRTKNIPHNSPSSLFNHCLSHCGSLVNILTGHSSTEAPRL